MMRSRIKVLTFLLIVVAIIIIPQSSMAFISGDVSIVYRIDTEWAVVWINADASITLQYNVTITYESSALGYLTIGLPARGFDVLSAEDVAGASLTYQDVSSSSYYAVEVYFGHPMNPGESGTVILLATVPNMLSPDTMNPGYMGLQFVPTYFDAWTADLRVAIVPPDGVTEDTIKTSTPAFLTTVDGAFAVYWTFPNVSPNSQLTFGVSIPEEHITLPNQSPVANISDSYTGTEGASITFNGSSSTDPDGTIVSYKWNFGDGAIGTDVIPVHVYTHEGIYTVTLTVVDDRGATSIGTTTAIIRDTEPSSEFVATPRSGASPLVVTFVDESTSYDGITSWDWAFGDGDHSTTPNPTHTFTTVSTYTVTLIVYEGDGDSSTQTKVDYIALSVPWWQEYWYIVTAIVCVALLGGAYGLKKFFLANLAS